MRDSRNTRKHITRINLNETRKYTIEIEIINKPKIQTRVNPKTLTKKYK